jgi:hypothetical protein
MANPAGIEFPTGSLHHHEFLGENVSQFITNKASGAAAAQTNGHGGVEPGSAATNGHGNPAAEAVAEAKATLAQEIRVSDALFKGSPLLKHIADSADARGSSRVAALVQGLMRISMAIGPAVVIPAHLGGSHVGLSLLHALVGETSGGKGRAEAVGHDAIALCSRGRAYRFEPVSPSTGEGLVSVFADTSNNPDTGRTETSIHTPSALLTYKDAETLGALVSRSGSTLGGMLLSMYMGDGLGFITREKARRISLPAHTYAAGLTAGVRPDNSGVLLSEEMRSVGMSHRFVWTPVRNGYAMARKTPPAPITVELPDFGCSGGGNPYDIARLYAPGEGVDPGDLVMIEVAAKVADEIHAADAVKDLDVFGAVPPGEDQLYGHVMLTRLKLAFPLAAMHGETGVSERWWEAAGTVMDVSAATMDAVATAAGAAEITAEQRMGVRLGYRYQASDHVRDNAATREVADKLYTLVGEEYATVNDSARIGSKKRHLIPDAWQWLIKTGKVECYDHEWQPGRWTTKYRRAREAS